MTKKNVLNIWKKIQIFFIGANFIQFPVFVFVFLTKKNLKKFGNSSLLLLRFKDTNSNVVKRIKLG